ncbi:MAG: hypothetical protein HUU48_07090 [Flavobacteriales bacterium]|nr:hypothetical protein [Flavobacteriales bacterium]
MKKNKISYLFLLLIGLFYSKNAFLQNVNDTFIVVKPYEPVISDAFKIKDNPSISDTGKIIPSLNYLFLNTRAIVPFSIISIEPAKIKGEPLVKLYHSYIKAGIGNNTTPLAEIYYNSVRNKSYSFGINAKHFSSNGISNIDYSSFSENKLNIYGKKFLKRHTLYGDGFYSRNVVHYYGMDSLVSPEIIDKSGLKQNYSSFGGKVGLLSNLADSSVYRYDIKSNYKYIYDLYNTGEHYAKIDANIGRYFDFDYYHLKTTIDYNKYSSATDTLSNSIISIQPGITSMSRKWRLNVGLNITAELANVAKFRFYPNAEFRYNLISEIVIPYLGITGNLKRTNFDYFVQQNPFVRSSLNLINENTRYHGYIGIRGNFSSKVSFNVAANYSQIAGMAMFVKDYSEILRNKFDLVYDTVDVTNLRTEISFQNREKLRFLITTDYNMFATRNQKEVWHRPNFKANISSIYDLADKIIIRLDIFGIDKQYVRTFERVETTTGFEMVQNAVRIEGWIDANIGIEYRYTKRISAFVNFNNLLSKGYQRWQDYTTMRFNVLGGLTYSF